MIFLMNILGFTLGGLTLLAPLTLLGLISLPIIWWILKITPPRPHKMSFPPLRLLQQVKTEEETPNATPLWLLLFRLLLVSLIIFALSLPIIKQAEGINERPITLLLDTHWGAGANWNAISREAEARLIDARRKNLEVRLITTTQPSGTNDLPAFGPAEDALNRLETIFPEALPFDEAYVTRSLSAPIVSTALEDSEALWISAGLDSLAMEPAIERLQSAAKITRIVPVETTVPLIAGEVNETADGFQSVWHRPEHAGTRSSIIEAIGRDGRLIARETVNFAPGQARADISFRLPPNLRRRIAQIRSSDARTVGSVKLFDDSWGRPVIGLLTPGEDTASPLLSEPFYTQSALVPFADMFTGDLDYLLSLAPEILIMPDVARASSKELTKYVEQGGLLIRFAGPKLAQRADDLLPVLIRDGDNGGRAFGGALTWEDPQNIAAFENDSPFFGLNVPKEIEIKRQVMAVASAETDSKTWARLVDGSPIVTAAPRGLGQIVLFHVTASPDWSNLALSGLYVEMLRRILPLAGQSSRKTIASSGDWSPDRMLNAFGRLDNPSIIAAPLPAAIAETAPITRIHPPGLYRQGQRLKARNMINDPSLYDVKTNADSLPTERLGGTRDQNIIGWLLALAMIGLALDVLCSLFASGRLKPRRTSVIQAAAIMMTFMVLIPIADANAQDAPDVVLDLHIGYVKTGNGSLDDISEDAMRGLSKALNDRTTIEPVGVRGIDLDQDELLYFPFIYWPVMTDIEPLSPETAAKINAYMASGGTMVLDTQDHGDRAFLSGTPHPGLARLGEQLDMPALMKIPEDHVIRKTFYLIDTFPGRWATGPVWIDRNRTSTSRDGVSSIIVTGNDLSAAWAVDSDDIAYVELENDIARQREFALRFGVNIAMYALSGNYKADQVHAAALIERLGKKPDGLGPLAPEP